MNVSAVADDAVLVEENEDIVLFWKCVEDPSWVRMLIKVN